MMMISQKIFDHVVPTPAVHLRVCVRHRRWIRALERRRRCAAHHARLPAAAAAAASVRLLTPGARPCLVLEPGAALKRTNAAHRRLNFAPAAVGLR